ncbi:MAG: OmpP1/FadL family transporter [Sphingomonadales bacterium]
MRNITYCLALLFCSTLFTELQAQEPDDALRYAWTQPNGTARQQAIGGAMGSLGGDLSALYINPAGLGFYKTGDLVLSPSYQQTRKKSNYLGRVENEQRGNIGYGTLGVVTGTQFYEQGPGKKAEQKRTGAFAIALNQTANFSSNLLYRGLNTRHSYSQRFLEEVGQIGDANQVAQNFPFGSSLAFNTYWIDTVGGGSSGNFRYRSSATPSTGLLQENSIKNRGAINELAVGYGGSVNEKIYFGFTVGIPFIFFDRTSIFTEADATQTLNNFDYATFEQRLETNGNGLNLKMGLLYRPAPFWRFGVAFHTPTWLRLTDIYAASITTDTENYKGIQTQSSSLFTNGEDAQFSYFHFTPYRFLISGSYVINETEDITRQKGFLTADLEYINYSASSFRVDPEIDGSQATRTYFKNLNTAIDNSFKSALTLRLGGELKFTKIMTRLGMALMGNPYKNGYAPAAGRMQLSGGLGYRDKGNFVDVTLVHTNGKDSHYAYRLLQQPVSGASIRDRASRIVITFGHKF